MPIAMAVRATGPVKRDEEFLDELLSLCLGPKRAPIVTVPGALWLSIDSLPRCLGPWGGPTVTLLRAPVSISCHFPVRTPCHCAWGPLGIFCHCG